MRLALFEPDIPQNTGAIARLAACFGLALDIIEPAGFPVSDRAFRRAGMDYLDKVEIRRHESFASFDAWRRCGGMRLVLATTKAHISYVDFAFARPDIVLFGRESAGAPALVHASADARIGARCSEAQEDADTRAEPVVIAGSAS